MKRLIDWLKKLIQRSSDEKMEIRDKMMVILVKEGEKKEIR